jgi:exoribonuclease R
MRNELTENEKKLADLMSEISENCYSAGWMLNIEYVLWHAVISGPRSFGRGEITQKDIDELTRLSNTTKTWIVFDDKDEETPMPLETWKALFITEVSKDSGKLRS